MPYGWQGQSPHPSCRQDCACPMGLAKTISIFYIGKLSPIYLFSQIVFFLPKPCLPSLMRINGGLSKSNEAFCRIGFFSTFKSIVYAHTKIIAPDETVLGHPAQQTLQQVKIAYRRMGDYRQ